LFFVLDSFQMRIYVGGFRVWVFQLGSEISVPGGVARKVIHHTEPVLTAT
jgi:hypothetical protein